MHPLLSLALFGCCFVNTVLLACLVFLYQDTEHPSVMPSLWPWLLWGWILLVSTPILGATVIALGFFA